VDQPEVQYNKLELKDQQKYSTKNRMHRIGMGPRKLGLQELVLDGFFSGLVPDAD
jgi:hypothetical protein